ncbi:MAG: UDP-N-acetylmuramate--L-alanine ligase [candidate division WOR-3 bacterium]
MLSRIRRFHFTGIGGTGMSGLALVLKNSGFEVTGSDLQRSEVTSRLEKEGIKIFYDHKEENIGNCQVLVYSSACPPDNPEIVAARRSGRIVLRRAEMLQELLRMRFSIVVAGSHGKTTVSSLIAFILEKGGFDPTLIIGGRIKGWESGGKLGKSQLLVCEADESDKSFLFLTPHIACVTNVDREHLDFYGYSFRALRNAFLSFLLSVPLIDGICVLCNEDPVTKALAKVVKRQVLLYGLEKPPKRRRKGIEERESYLWTQNLKIFPFGSEYEVVKDEEVIGKVEVSLPGIHNVLNSLAACGIALLLDVPFSVIQEGLKNFSGVERRLEFKGEKKGIKVYDDYAHHPTEIKATLNVLRNLHPKERIIAIFQPHRYTRTSYLYEDFGRAFPLADLLIITEIYPASEKPIPGVSAELIYEVAKKEKGENVFFVPDKDQISSFLLPLLKEEDLIITLGAGNIWQVGLEILKRLAKDLE